MDLHLINPVAPLYCLYLQLILENEAMNRIRLAPISNVITHMREFSTQSAIEFLFEHAKFITKPQMELLAKFCRVEMTPKPEAVATSTDDATIDLMTEVRLQLGMVRQLRENFAQQGEDADVGDLSKMVSASTTLLTLLNKLQTSLLNQDRLRKIELATVETVKRLEPDAQKFFFATLEKALKDV